MNIAEFEKALPKFSEMIDAALLAEVSLLRQENSSLREIIKILEKRIAQFDDLHKYILCEMSDAPKT